MASTLVPFKRDEGSIPDHFFCKICFELPTQKVFQCKKGHPLCETCHSKCKECPKCRFPFDKSDPIRCLYFEDLLDTVVTVNCAYKGCEFHPTRNLVQDHQSKCHFNIEKFGDLVEVCKQIGYGDCDFCFNNGNIIDAVKHLVRAHGCISTEGDHLQIELVGLQEAADSNVNCFWTPVISDLKEKNYFILTLASFNRIGSLACFSFIMPKLNEIEETIKIEYSLSNNNNAPFEWGIFQNAMHFSKVFANKSYFAKVNYPCFTCHELKFHILENGNVLVNVRVQERGAKNNTKRNEKKVDRIVCRKREFTLSPDVSHPDPHRASSKAHEIGRLLVSKDPTEILVQNLPDSVTKDYIKIIFSKFGEIRSINFVKQGPNGPELCNNVTNTCKIEFASSNSIKKVVEKMGRIFMKKNGKKYRLNVLIMPDSEPVPNALNLNGDQPIKMNFKNDSFTDFNDKARMERDELEKQIQKKFSNPTACTDGFQFKLFKDMMKIERDELTKQIQRKFSHMVALSTDSFQLKLFKDYTMFTAAQYGNIELLEYCIGKGIDPNVTARKPNEAIDSLSVLGFTMLDQDKNIGLEKAKLLVENGANVHYNDPLGRSLLHHSVLWGSDAAVKFFLGKGLKANAVSKAGETPLHVALSKTGVQFLIQKVTLLLDHGADLTIKDNDGQSCLDLVGVAPFEYWDQIKAIFKKHQEQGNAVLEGEI